MLTDAEIALRIAQNRDFMKCPAEDEADSDQQLKRPQPPLCTAAKSDRRIPLTKDFDGVLVQRDFLALTARRVSHRFYADKPMTLDQLAFLLWASQGVKSIRGKNYAALRTVPGGGARHAYETYLAVRAVEGLVPGVYHYLPLEHALEPISAFEGDMGRQVGHLLSDQPWAAGAAVTFFWAVDAYRGEWRYTVTAHRVLLMDVGYISEALYLACEAIGCGTCAVGAYRQAETDRFLGIDGVNLFTVLASPVGPQDIAKNDDGNAQLYKEVLTEA